MKNIDKHKILSKLSDCKQLFSNEVLLLTLKADQIFVEKSAALLKGVNDVHYEEKQAKIKDNLNKLMLRVLFEDLCNKLINIKVHDIIRIFNKSGKPNEGMRVYKDNKALNLGD